MEAHSANILRKSGRGASREGGICSGRCGAGGRMGAGAACADGLPMVGRSEFSGNGLRWSVGRRPRKRMCGISGGAAVGWRTEGSGRCVVGAGRVLKCRASGVVPRTGGAGSSGSRAGVGPVRAGADRWARRGPAWTLCSGEAGMEPLPFPNGAGRIPRTEPLFRRGASLPAGPASGRCGPLGATRVGVDPLFRRGRSHLRTGRCRFRTGRSHPPDARPPIFARSALRKGPDAPFSDSFCPFLQRPAAPEPTPFANPRFRRSGKAKKLFFYFYFIIKDVSLCSQNNT